MKWVELVEYTYPFSYMVIGMLYYIIKIIKD